MNDDTTKGDGWGSSEPSDTGPRGATQETQETATSDAPRVGYCQDCGRPLTQETLRNVGTGIFCEPCLTARVAATSSTYTTVPPYAPAAGQSAATGDPSPILAGILGFIPGVGAMYNGQFAKGIVHLAIFVMLTFLANNVSGLCWIFCWGWIFYMAFEAYHTAIARRDGLPLPNAFGFNDLGERMGFGKSWSGVGSTKPAGGAVPQASPTPTPASANPAYAPVNPVPVGTAPDWVGYVPPSVFAVPPPTQPAEPLAASQRASAWGHTPYAETFTGDTQVFGAGVSQPAAPIPPPAARRFPTGAIWLIGLGVLILIANLLPDWKLTEQWWAPLFFAGLSIWLLTRRLHLGVKLVSIIRWPVILMVLAVMLALHAAYVPVTIGLTVSVLLIVFGALLLLERTAGVGPLDGLASPAANYQSIPGMMDNHPPEATARAAWVAPDNAGGQSNPDEGKGGK